MRIAVLGTGRMGRELVRRLLAHGHEVRVYNRTTERSVVLVADGATLARTPADAVLDADAVVTVLFGPNAVREVVVEGDLGLAKEALWIDITTVGPADADEFAAWARGRGIHYVHAPVVGSLGPARAGALGVFLGGETSAVAAATELTRLWADPTRVHVFDTASQAATAKLAVNLGLAVATQGLAEAILLGESRGLSPETILQILDKTPLSGVVSAKGRTILEGGFADAQFTVDALAKDAALASTASAFPLPALDAAARSLARRHDLEQGDWDFSVIAAPDLARREAIGDPSPGEA